MLQTCNLSSFLQFLKIFRLQNKLVPTCRSSHDHWDLGPKEIDPIGLWDFSMGFGLRHSNMPSRAGWHFGKLKRAPGSMACIVSSIIIIWDVIIWIHMMCIILLSQDIPNLWISPFEPLMPLDPSTTSKTWRLERGRRGGKTCCTDWIYTKQWYCRSSPQKNTSIQFSKSCYILHIVLRHSFAVSM